MAKAATLVLPPTKYGQGTPPELRELCDRCPVRDPCAEAGKQAFAGVWAGRLIATKPSALKELTTPRPLGRSGRRALAG